MCVAPLAAIEEPSISPRREQGMFREDVEVVAMGLMLPGRRSGGCPTRLFTDPGSGVISRRGDAEWERLRESWWEEFEMEGSEDESLIPEPKYGE